MPTEMLSVDFDSARDKTRCKKSPAQVVFELGQSSFTQSSLGRRLLCSSSRRLEPKIGGFVAAFLRAVLRSSTLLIYRLIASQ
jgi:hypothetical protein